MWHPCNWYVRMRFLVSLDMPGYTPGIAMFPYSRRKQYDYSQITFARWLEQDV